MPSDQTYKYFVRFHCSTKLSVGDAHSHQGDATASVMYEWPRFGLAMTCRDLTVGQSPQVHSGLCLDVFSIQEHPDIAYTDAHAISDCFASILAFVHTCYVSDPFPVVRGNISADSLSLENTLLSVVNESTMKFEFAPRLISQLDSSTVNEALWSIVDNQNEIIRSSLHWFRRSLAVNDLRDSFLLLWIALEYVEHAIKENRGLPRSWDENVVCKCKIPDVHCAACGNPLTYKRHGGSAGLKLVCKHSGVSNRDWRRLQAVRGKVVHSEPYSGEELKWAAQHARQLYYRSIGLLIGVDFGRLLPFVEERLRLETPPTEVVYFQDIKLTQELTPQSSQSLRSVRGHFSLSGQYDQPNNRIGMTLKYDITEKPEILNTAKSRVLYFCDIDLKDWEFSMSGLKPSLLGISGTLGLHMREVVEGWDP